MKISLQWILNIFRYHKKRILFLVGSTIFCALILFPFDDLSDFVTAKITMATGNNLNLSFDGLSFGFLPKPGINMNRVVVKSVYAPTFKIDKLGFAPAVFSLIRGRPGGTVKANGLFDGRATFHFGPSRQLGGNPSEMSLNIRVEKIKLEELSKFLEKIHSLPLNFSGSMDLQSRFNVDLPNFQEQPEGDFNLFIQKLELPAANVPLGMGMNLSLPTIQLNQVKLVGKMAEGKLNITQGKIGEPKNDFHGSITGDVFLDFQPGGRLKKGGYQLKINLNISNKLKEELKPILGLVDIYEGIGEKHKFKILNGVRYSMELSAYSFQSLPKVNKF